MRPFGVSSLSSRLIILVLSALLPALGLMLYFTSAHRRTERAEVGQKAQMLVRMAEANHRGLVEGARQLLLTLASLPEVRQLDGEACSRLFTRLLEHSPAYANIGATDAQGLAFASAMPLPKHRDMSDRHYFKRALAERGFVVGEYIVSRAAGKPTVNFAYPVLDETDSLRAVLVAALDLSWLNQFLARIPKPLGATALLIDRQGAILARHPDPEKWIGRVMPETAEIKAGLAQGEGVREMPGPDGIRRLYAFTPLNVGPGGEPDVFLAVGLSLEAAYARSEGNFRISLITLAVVGGLTLLGAWFMGQAFVARPVKSLLDVTERIAGGDLTARTGLAHGLDEFGRLAASFDNMAQELKNRTTELDHLFQGSPDLIVISDTEGRLKRVNPACLKILGFSPDELIGRRVVDFVHPEDLEATLEARKALIEGEWPDAPFENRCRTKDGSYRWLAWTGVPNPEAGLNFAVARDVTAGRAAEEELKRSEANYRQLVETLHEGVWAVDQGAVTTFVNPRLAEMLGYTVEEMVGRSLFGFMDQLDAAETERGLERRRQGLSEEREVELLRKDGSRIQALVRVSPIIDDQGAYVGSLAAVADITDRKRDQEALLRLNRTLKTLSECNQALVRAEDETELLQLICDLVIEFGGYRFAWIGLAEEDERRTVRPAAQAGAGEGYLESGEITWSDDPTGRGPMGRAIKSGQPFVTRWIEGDSADEPWREKALQRGWQSAIALPLIGQDQTLGALGVYTDESDAFGEREMELLYELAQDVAYGIIALRTKAERDAGLEALRQSEERYRALFDGIYSGVAVYEVKDDGRDFIFKDFNAAGERIDNDRREQLIGKSIFEVRPGVEQFGLIEVFRRVWRTGRAEHYPVTLYQDELLTGWYENYVYKLPSGEIVAVFDNIIERKRAEEALRQSEEKYRTLFETMAQGVVYQDREGKVTSANPAAERILGLSLDQMQGRTSSDQRWQAIREDGSPFPGEEHPAMVALRTGEEVHGVVMGVFNPERDEYRWLRIHAAPQFRPGEAEPYQVFATFGDMTPLKRAEEALRESETRYRLLTEMLPVAILAHREDRIIFANPAAAALFGAERPEDLLDRAVTDLVPPEYQALAVERRKQVLRVGSVSPAAYKWVRLDGRVMDVEVSGSRISQLGEDAVLSVLQDVTERKRAEEALRYQEFLLSEMGRIARIGGWEFDPETGQGTWTEEVARIHDLDPEKETSLQYGLSFYEGESRSKIERAVKEAIELGKPYDLELELVTVQGVRKWVQAIAHPLVENGKVTRVRGSFQDITERKRTEAALRAERDKAQMYLDTAEAIFLALNEAGEVDLINRKGCQILGYKHGELVGENWLEKCLPVRLREEIGSIFGRMLAGEIEPFEFRENEVLTKSGEERLVRWHNTLIRDEQGRVIGIFSSGEDVTERRKAEQERDRLFQHSVDMLCVAGFDGFFKQVNPAWTKALGWTAEELVSKPWLDFVHPDDLAATIEAGERLLAGGGIYAFENRYLGKDGVYRWVSWNSFPLTEEKLIFAVARDVTERKKAEEEQRKLVAVIENSDDFISLSALDGQVIYLNQAGCRLVGLGGLEEARSTTMYDYVSDEQRQILTEEALPEVMAGGLWRGEGKIRHFQTGELIDVEVTFFMVRDADSDQPVCLAVVIRDIRERKRAEEALQEEMLRRRILMDRSHDGIAIINQEHRVVEANQRFTEMLGYAPDEMTGLHTWDWEAEATEEEIRANFADLTKTSTVFETRHRRKDGTTYNAEVSASGAEVVGKPLVFTITRDITERKRAEEALKESEERFRLTFDQSPLGAAMLDFDGRYLRVNAQLARFTGYSQEELTSMTVADTTAPEEVQDTLDRIGRLGRGELSNYQVEKNFRHKDGHIVYSRLSAQVIKDTAGRPLYLLSQVEDITETRRIEAERIRLEGQLVQAQKMEAIGTLAGGIAHDFNNMLAAMIGYAEMALMDAGKESGLRRSLEQILKGGQRAKDLVKQILAFSRQQEQERGPVKLGLLIKETIRFLRASLPTTIEIRQQVDADSGVVVADPTQVHQVIMNLAANAAHAMRAQGGVLTIGLSNVNLEAGAARDLDPDLEAGSYVRLSVADTGTGMEPGIIGRIFDPFFTTKKPGEGTGLGLSVVHGIIKSLGGGITVSSQMGRGTTFQVYLPRSEEDGQPEIERTGLLPRGQGRVLLVDDEAALVDMGRQMLERLGYEVVALTSSLEALKLFQTQPEAFDVVVTDLTMPQMTGFTLAKEILALRPDTPVILCTGYSELVTPEQANKVGVKEYIMKPVVMGDLGLAILRARGQAPAD